MAVKIVEIPETVILQPEETQSKTSGGQSRTVSYKGTMADLEAVKDSISIGDNLNEDETITGATIRRSPGNLGVLEITVIPDTDETTEEGTTSVAERAAWTCKSVRNDKSILAYCGPTDQNPNRAWIESWMSERDAEIAKRGNFRKDDGTESDLSTAAHQAATSELMTKIESGIDTVVRFYPVLTCTSTYSRIPGTFFSKLGFVDDPAAPAANEVCAPSNLSTIISNYSWLKVQDDVQETADGKWQRTESWMGSENTWDGDLYGSKSSSDRWPMPLVK